MYGRCCGEPTTNRVPAVEFGELTFDLSRREVYKRGELVELRAKEYDLFAFLAAAPQRVFSARSSSSTCGIRCPDGKTSPP